MSEPAAAVHACIFIFRPGRIPQLISLNAIETRDTLRTLAGGSATVDDMTADTADTASRPTAMTRHGDAVLWSTRRLTGELHCANAVGGRWSVVGRQRGQMHARQRLIRQQCSMCV